MSIAELRNLPPQEKLKVIELLWSDLAGDPESFESPPWQEAELRQAEADFRSGKADVLDWEDAKKDLRKRFE